MSIPVEEMLDDLRLVLERFESNKNADSLDLIFKETMRINDLCENVYLENEQ